MDTKFWGPGAWELLHTITYTSKASPAALREFFDLLPFVLPCKFCRASLTDYYEKDPLPPTGDLQHWLYRIHNLVNGKLRGQGLMKTRNPTFDTVDATYRSACDTRQFPAWDFLYSIAYNHPLRVTSTPMPGLPAAELRTDREKNRWNILPARTRFSYWCAFWRLLPEVLPPKWKEAWEEASASSVASPCELRGKRDAVAWVWNIRCKFDTSSSDPYRQVCSRLLEHSSGCSKSKRARTCRKKR